MNNEKIGILTCANYFKELKTIIGSGESSDIELFCTKPTCSNPTKDERSHSLETFNSYTEKVQELLMLLPKACSGLDNSNIEPIFCHDLCPPNCTDLIAPKSFVNQLIDEGNFIVTPGWLFTWENYVKKRWKFSDESAKLFFKETTKQICVLDTGVYDDYSRPLTELCNYVGLEHKTINIGLDFFKNYVEKLVLARRTDMQEAKTQKCLKEVKKKIADYTMALDIIKNLSNQSSEETVIQNFFHLFTILFSPQKMTYTSFDAENHIKNIIYPTEKHKEIEPIESHVSTPVLELHPSGKGFKINAIYDNELLGYIEINDILFTEHIDRYTALTQSISAVFGLLIFNSRQYNQLLKEKIEVLQLNEEMLQDKNNELQKVNAELLASEYDLKATNEELTVTSEALLQSNYDLEIAIRKSKEQELFALERNKELNGLYSLGLLTEKQVSLEEIYREFVSSVVAKSMQFPDKTVALLNINDQTYCNLENYKIPNERKHLSAEIIVFKQKIGEIIITYTEDLPFIEVYEQNLINAYAERISKFTEHIITSNELKIAKEKAEESDRLKSAFLLNMSHEIKSPMNSINGFSQLIQNPQLSEEKRTLYTSIIINSSNHLQSIVENILTISSLETKQERLSIETINVNKIILELISIFELQATNQNISINAKLPLSDNKMEIYTDKTKFTQILTNLLSNALKFTNQGHIEIGYTLKSVNETQELEFYVKDTGIGIAPEMHETIFERFIQVETGFTRKYGGNGLGLSISKGFIELLGGKIWVQSELGEGSTFYFTFPYKPVTTK